MIDIKYKNLLLATPLVLLQLACASPVANKNRTSAQSAENQLYPISENYDLDLIEYTVKRGDRLSDIAKEITGLSSNWPEIAEFNSIADPRDLRTGTVLAIPTDLIVGYVGTTSVVASQPELSAPEAQSSSLALRRNDAVEVPVVVTPINTNRDFDLNPIDPNAPTPTATQSYRGVETKIKVVGSYYPKAIYTEPAAYSKLILRAAPGTLFVLDSKVNDWYKIDTTSGSGYIRTSDAAIVEKSE